MAKDLIFELGSEELPAGLIHASLKDLESIFKKKLKERSLGFKSISTLATPRRLTLIVEGLDEKQPDTASEARGPGKNAAYDEDGRPTKALLGFARAQGLKPEELKTVAGEKGEYLYAVKKVKGKKTAELLPEILKSVLSSLTFPKAMRWGSHEITFARPLHWILAVYGAKKVGFDYGHVRSGDVTYGHRFLKGAKAKIKVDGAGTYIEKLRECHVIAFPSERKKIIEAGLEKEARGAGGTVLKDEELLAEVVNLVEYPVVIKGSFDRGFLELPGDVVINAMREHQRYFSVVDKSGRLLPYFITVANTPVKDIDVVRAGNERVLKARLNDAKFYFEKDIKTPLKERVEKLKGVVFQSKLGTSFEKVERFTRLAIFIGSGIGEGDNTFCAPMDVAERVEDFLKDEYNPKRFDRKKISPQYYNKFVIARAALLCKADLTSGMVGEFPKLQGIMGKEYAKRDAEEREVSEAIYEHYLPAAAEGGLPEGDAGAIIGIADRLDTIAGCFGVGLMPTGAHDPYGLRRQALAIIAIILDKNYKFSLDVSVDMALYLLKEKLTRNKVEARNDVLEFFRERLKNQLLLQNFSYDAIEAVLSAPWFDICDAVKRVVALEKFKKNPACPSLVTAFKRVSNILKGQEITGDAPLEEYFSDPHEKALWRVSEDIAPIIEENRLKGDYEKAFSTLAGIKDVIDKFFDKVLVMTDDEGLRRNRLALLSCVRGLYCQIADISKLVV